MGDSSFKTKNCVLEGNIKVDLEVISFTFECGMGDFVELDVNITRVEIESLLALTLKKNNISILHTLFQLVSQISWSECDLVASTNRTLACCTNTGSSACLAFHLHLLHFVLDLYLSSHLSRTAANGTRGLLSSWVTCALAMLANLTPTEAVNHLSSSVELI